MRLAICCYVDAASSMLEEFRWLYTSWEYSGRFGDIIAFAHPAAVPGVTLPGVTVVPTAARSECEREWSEYPFINSVGFVAEADEALFDGYTHILRTDCDCFLTPRFPRDAPRLPLFGRGQYVQSADVATRLGRLAAKWGLHYDYIHNIGSTILASVEAVRHYDDRHLEISRMLLRDAFPHGRGKWPGWWWGVLSMYSGELAANAIWGLGVTVGGLDCMSLSGDPMGCLDFHIHGWRSEQDWSKNHFRAGKYDHIPLESVRPDSPRDYCMMISKMAQRNFSEEA